MNNIQENKYNSYRVSNEFIIANMAIINTLPGVSEYLGIIQNNIHLIEEVSELQNINKTGYADNKAELRNKLTELSIDLSRKLTAYATFNKNQPMLNEVYYTSSDLKRSTDTTLVNIALGLYNQAKLLFNDLISYGVTPNGQTELITTADQFRNAIPKPRLSITEKRQRTEQLKTLFKETDEAFNNIDLAVEILHNANPIFYEGYKAARKIVHSGKTYISVKGTVSDSKTGEPLKSATIKFIPEELSIPTEALSEGNLIKKTAEKGGFIIKSLNEGSYKVAVSKPGYAEQHTIVNVCDGETSKLHIKLEKN